MVRVAVVTGANKGIGLAIVEILYKKFSGDIYLTARSEDRGQNAVEKLRKAGCTVFFHQLDLLDKSSIEALKVFLLEKYGGLDLLVNNAGIAFKAASSAPFAEQAEVTMATNFWGTLDVCNALFPLLRSHARVVHVSSFVSIMALRKCSEERQKILGSCKTMTGLKDQMSSFVIAAKAGDHAEKGWASLAYGTTKLAVNIMTAIQQQEMDGDTSRSDIVINCCCPGYVATDMSSFKGTSTVEEGAANPVHLALLPEGVTGPRGEFLPSTDCPTFTK